MPSKSAAISATTQRRERYFARAECQEREVAMRKSAQCESDLGEEDLAGAGLGLVHDLRHAGGRVPATAIETVADLLHEDQLAAIDLK
jgi:hypothetical protein